MIFLSCVCYSFVRVCLFVPCGHLLGKDWPFSSCLWCITVSLSLSHWYPGSGVVLDFIDFWYLHSYLLNIFLLQQQQNLGRRFGTSKMHLSPKVAFADVRSKAVVLFLLIRGWLLLPLWDSVIVLCIVVRYFVSILVLQSSRWGRKSWLLCFVCLPGVSWLLYGYSSRCYGFVCRLWLWYFLIILTYYLGKGLPFGSFVWDVVLCFIHSVCLIGLSQWDQGHGLRANECIFSEKRYTNDISFYVFTNYVG